MRIYKLLLLKIKYSSKPVVLFGASTLGQKWFDYFLKKKVKVDFFCDNNSKRWGSDFCGIKIISPSELVLKYSDSNILITSMYVEEIKGQLEEKGLKHIYNFSKFINDKEDQSFWVLFREHFFQQFFIKLPTVVNFPVTSKCNLKCVMCNVWRKELQYKNELSAQEIGRIFFQKLFCKVTHVGLSGGEPFLRKDIVEVVAAIIASLPQLESVSIITNGLATKTIIEKAKKLEGLCKNKNIHFSLLVSIDGIGEVHNKIRGNSHCFNHVKETILRLKENRLSCLSLCCTITKYNVNYLYEVLEFAKDVGLNIKFRIATEIRRLYNSELTHSYSFNRDELIKIAKFYDKLYHVYEKNPIQKAYYQSVKNQILSKDIRMIGCDWKDKGISIDAEGNLFYCFVKSHKIANVLNEDGWDQYKKNIKIREAIKKKNCFSCIHDYKGDIDLKIYLRKKFNDLAKSIKEAADKVEMFLLEYFLPLLIIKKRHLGIKKSIKQVLITGWYGTETTGDKAILAGIVESIRKYAPSIKLVISSLFPYYTEETMRELELANSNVVLMNSKAEKRELRKSDLVIMGGGPLMDITEMKLILKTFANAIRFNIPTLIYSCGLGPLRDQKIRKTVGNLLRLSNFIYFRDKLSPLSYPELVRGIKYKTLMDPAIIWLDNYSKPQKTEEIKRILFCIRDWPRNYTTYVDEMEYQNSKEQFVNRLCDFIKFLLAGGYQISFFPMNTFFAGRDDRDFFREIKKRIGSFSDNINYYKNEYTVKQAVNIFCEHDLVVGMRFHSVVFGTMLGVPTIAIEYNTEKGKVYGFMKDINMQKYCIMIEDIINSYENLLRVFNLIHEERANIIDSLKNAKSDMQFKNDFVLRDIMKKGC